jgi:hypothetical protein
VLTRQWRRQTLVDSFSSSPSSVSTSSFGLVCARVAAADAAGAVDDAVADPFRRDVARLERRFCARTGSRNAATADDTDAKKANTRDATARAIAAVVATRDDACAWCRRRLGTSVCARCRRACYCCRDPCQKAAYRFHKQGCKITTI